MPIKKQTLENDIEKGDLRFITTQKDKIIQRITAINENIEYVFILIFKNRASFFYFLYLPI